MDAYDEFVASSNATYSTYLGAMAAFLDAPGTTMYQAHVACTSSACTALASAKVVIMCQVSKPGETVIDELKVRDAIDKAMHQHFDEDDTVAYSLSFVFAETDQGTWRAVLFSIAFALVSVYVVMCLSTSPVIAAWVTLCVAFIDADLLLVIYLSGELLNSITYTCLIMSCGLAVDYCVHIGHSFEHALRSGLDVSTRAAAREAIVRMGASVFQGGMTTLLGTLTLAIASSVAFRTFFLCVFCTVVLGVAHGVVFLPVVLGYLTPRGCTGAESIKRTAKGNSV